MLNHLLAPIRKNFYIRAGIFAVGIVLFVAIFLIPKFLSTRELAKKVNVLVQENQNIQGKILTSEHSGEMLQKIKNRLEHYKRMIPARDQFAHVLDQIASKAQEDGLKVVFIRPVRNVLYESADENLERINAAQTEKVHESTLEMQVSGSFFDLGQYLKHLEQAPFKILVKNVLIRNDKKDAAKALQQPELTVHLTLAVLVMAPVEETK